jgi:hypothetical protein
MFNIYFVGIINSKINFLQAMNNKLKFFAINFAAIAFAAATLIMNGCSVGASASIHPSTTQAKDTTQHSPASSPQS